MNRDNRSDKEYKGNTNQSNSGSKALLIVSIVVASLLVISALSVFLYSKYQAQQALDAKANANETTEVDSGTARYEDYTTINYNGTVYEYNTNIKTIVFLGIDQLDGTEEEAGESGRSDTMIVMLVDSDKEEVTMLSISRDTQADVDITNDYGESLMIAEMHLALQYSYGDGGVTSCSLSRNAISRLLYDIPINYYMSMNLDGMDAIVNAIGGLTITMDDDYTYINEAFIEGETVVLDGDLADSFVRYRDTTVVGSNDQRMERQELFLQAFVAQMKSKIGDDTSSLESMWNLMSNFLTTDLSIDMIEMLVSYDMNEVSYKVPGETVSGEYHDEYIVDEEELQKILIELLYIEK